jgi:hypothetical protein
MNARPFIPSRLTDAFGKAGLATLACWLHRWLLPPVTAKNLSLLRKLTELISTCFAVSYELTRGLRHDFGQLPALQDHRPNFFPFTPSGLYETIDNNGDAIEDPIFQFCLKYVQGRRTVGGKAVKIPLINSGMVSGVNP